MIRLTHRRRTHPLLALLGFLVGVFVALLSYGDMLDSPHENQFIWQQPPSARSSPVGTINEQAKETPGLRGPEADDLSSASGKILSLYSEGSDVTLVQERLHQLGFLTQKATGRFDAATLAAVMAFQEAQGLVPDGKVGPNTYAALGI